MLPSKKSMLLSLTVNTEEVNVFFRVGGLD